MQPLSISVIIPCYSLAQRFKLLRQCFAAVREQTRAPDEVILVDDGSPDTTVELLEEFVRQERGLRCPLRVLPLAENGGASASRNAGIRAAQGDILAFCDYDDLWFPSYLERLDAAFRADPSRMWILAKTVFHTRYRGRQKCSFGTFPERINEMSFEALCAYCVEHNFPVAMGSAVACRRAAFELQESLYFDSFLSKRTAEDVFFGYQWLVAGLRPYFMREPAVIHRTVYTHLSRGNEAFLHLDEEEVFRYFEQHVFPPLLERVAAACPEYMPQIRYRLKKTKTDFKLKGCVMRGEALAAVRLVAQHPRRAKSLLRFLLLLMVERCSLDRLLHEYLFRTAPRDLAAEREALPYIDRIEATA